MLVGWFVVTGTLGWGLIGLAFGIMFSLRFDLLVWDFVCVWRSDLPCAIFVVLLVLSFGVCYMDMCCLLVG